jgi:hypothetical protein
MVKWHVPKREEVEFAAELFNLASPSKMSTDAGHLCLIAYHGALEGTTASLWLTLLTLAILTDRTSFVLKICEL